MAKKLKLLPKEIRDRPTVMKDLYRRLRSNAEWVKNGVTVEVNAGVFGPTSISIAVDYRDLELLITKGWLDQSIITWFMA